MRRTLRRFTAVCLLGGFFLFPSVAAAQKALIYCPSDDPTGCAGVAGALASAYADGVDRGYDGSGGTIDLAAADLSGYAVFVVPSLADDETVQPYARLRDSAVAERLRGLVTGRVAVWSGTPDLGTSNRDKKDALLRNLAGWARADTEAGRGAGLVALLDASGEGQYGWLEGISGATVGAGSAFDVYANVEVKTSTGTTILSSGGLQLGYTAMAQGALTSAGGTVDATGGRTTNAVLVTFAMAPGDGSIATVTTDKEDYAPGETVTITGTGWEPGETVSMKLHEEPLVHGDRTLSAVADADGNFVNASFTVEEHDLGVRFVLTATGQTSARTAQATFTDGRVVTSATLNGGSSVTVAPGAAIPASVTVNITAAGNVDWGSTRWTVGPITACVNHGNHTGASSNFTESFTITAPNAAGAYDAVFEAFSNDNCGGTGGGNTPRTLVNGVTVAAANQPPVANAGGPYTGNEGSAVTLSGSATDDGPQTSLTYAWTYAAGAGVDAGASCAFSPSAAVASPSVTCTDDGALTLTLTVTDGSGANDTDTATLTLQNVPATASAGGPYTGTEGTAIPLLGTGSDAGANDAAALTYAWSVTTSGIDAGGTCTIANPAQPSTTVTCTDDGAFSVSLLVTDGDAGASTPSQATLTVGNAVPVADAGGPYSATEGTAVQLAGSGNDPGDNDDATLTYQWTAITTGIDAGGACTFNDATNKNAEVTCTDDGAFKVRLVVTDNDGGSSVAAEADLTIGNAAPVADAGGPYTGVEGAPVALEGSVQDAGPNDSPTWSWDYIDGAGIDGGTCAFSDETDLAPTVTCTDDGTVQLTLTVTDGDGGEHTDQATLTLTNADPVADAGGNYSGTEGSAVQLDGEVADAGTNDTHTWSWDYLGTNVDPGATCTFTSVTDEDPSITCTDDGTVELTLTVTDDDGASDSDTATLTLGNAVPVAAAGGPYSGTEGTAVELAGSANDPGDNDDSGLTLKWTADASGLGGGTCSFDDDTKADAEITCTDNGTVTLTLVATDDDGGASTGATATLTIANSAPVANAGGPYSGQEGSPVDLAGTVQDAGSSDTHTWSWNYTGGAGIDGGSCSFSDASITNPTITCTDDGTVELTLTVTDDDGESHQDTATLTLANVDPVADAGGGPTGYAGVEGSEVSLNGTATDAGANDTHTWSWAYVGTNVDPGATCTLTSATAEDPSITCTDDGTVELTLTVTDDDGGSDTDTATLTLTNAAPVASAGGDASGDEGSAVVLSGSATDPGLNDVPSFLWAVNDDGISNNGSCTLTNPTSATAQLTCTDNGTATVTLTVTDDDGASDTDEATVTIQNVAPVADAGGTYSGSEGAAVSLDGEVTDAGTNDTHSWAWAYVDGAGIDGGTCAFSNPSAEDPTVTCTDDGTVQLTLTVTDDDGESGSDTATLTLANVAPVAAAGGPYASDEGSAVALMGSGDDQGDNDDAGLTYAWSAATTGIDAGGVCSFDDATSKNTTITCTDDGVFTLTLTVRDDDGGVGTDDAQLTVSNVAPVADAGTGYTGNEGEAVQLAGSINDAGANDTHVWSWNYTGGAGIDGGTCAFSNAAALNPTVTCTDDGTVELTLSVTDDDGASHTDMATLTLDNVEPVADAGGLNSMYSGAEGSAVQLNGTVTDAGTNDSHTWSWQYVGTAVDPGAACTFTNATAEDPKITCTDDGTVELTLTVTDDDGGTGTDKATLTLTNVAPVAAAGGPYSGTEGASIALTGLATDAGSNDEFTYEWTLDDSGIDGSGSCSIADPTSASTSITCTDDGSVPLALKVTDDDGAAHTSTTTLTVQNANPIASAGGPYSDQEGAAVTLSGSATDTGADELTYLWSVDAGGIEDGGTCTLSNPASASASVTCSDNGTAMLTLTVSDDDGGSGTSSSVLTVSNVAPLLSAITAPAAPTAISTPVAVSASFSDQGTNDTHVGIIDWGDGSTAALIAEANGSGTASGTHTYAGPGVYTVRMVVTDDDGAPSNESVFQYVVVYDPNGGFVTGGGWIMSQPGMYLPDVSLSGKANFGFVSKYQKGATVPTGNTEFQFHAGDLNFKSTSYEWLVVQGKEKASYKGVGSINGGGDYGFLLSVIDGGNTGDRFRIKIWDRANGDAVVYDNQVGAADDASATTALGGGSIVVHTPPAGKVAAK